MMSRQARLPDRSVDALETDCELPHLNSGLKLIEYLFNAMGIQVTLFVVR